MPEVSRFHGISIYIYYDDHQPPHFHARHGSEEVGVTIENPGVLEGDFPGKLLAIVLDWAAEREQELALQWENAVRHLPMAKIPPLE